MPSGFCLRAQLLLGQGYQNYRAKVEIRGSWYKMHQATTGRQHRRNGQQTRAKWLDLLYCSQTEVPMHLTKGWENVQAGVQVQRILENALLGSHSIATGCSWELG